MANVEVEFDSTDMNYFSMQSTNNFNSGNSQHNFAKVFTGNASLDSGTSIDFSISVSKFGDMPSIDITDEAATYKITIEKL